VVYPNSTVLARNSHEGSANVDAGEPGLPWAAQFLGVPASESGLFSWYRGWLSSHGWSHVKDSTATDSTGAKTADVSDWAKGQESFELSVDVSPSARANYGVTGNQLLVSTQYMAPAGVLGCT